MIALMNNDEKVPPLQSFCWPEELESKTAQGWEIHEYVKVQRNTTVQEQAVNPKYAGGSHNNYESTTIGTYRTVTLDTVGFLLRRRSEPVIAQLQAKVYDANNALQAAQKAAADAESLREKQRKDDADIIEAHVKTITKLEDRAEKAVSKANTLELDIAKIRKAVGEDRMREILGR